MSDVIVELQSESVIDDMTRLEDKRGGSVGRIIVKFCVLVVCDVTPSVLKGGSSSRAFWGCAKAHL